MSADTVKTTSIIGSLREAKATKTFHARMDAELLKML